MGILQESVVEDVGSVPVCRSCGSERVVREAEVCWNHETGLFELERVLQRERCLACNGPTEFRWVRKDALKRTRIRELNNRFRTEGHGQGTLLVTSGIKAMGEDFVRQVVDAVRRFDGFDADNDPWAEHDFGAIEIQDERVFWKIDAYDEGRKRLKIIPNAFGERPELKLMSATMDATPRYGGSPPR